MTKPNRNPTKRPERNSPFERRTDDIAIDRSAPAVRIAAIGFDAEDSRSWLYPYLDKDSFALESLENPSQLHGRRAADRYAVVCVSAKAEPIDLPQADNARYIVVGHGIERSDAISWIRNGADSIYDIEKTDASHVMEIIRSLATARARTEFNNTEFEQTSNLLENLPVGIYIVDTKTEPEIRIWNTAMERFFGISKKNTIGREVKQAIANRELAIALSTAERLDAFDRMKLDKPKGQRAADQRQRTIQLKKTPIRDRCGKIVALVGIVQDITELIHSEKRMVAALSQLESSNLQLEQNNHEIRSRIEKARQLAIDAQASNKAKTFFMSNISHELRTPLNSIVSLSHVLLEQAFGEVNYKQRELLEIISESGDHLQSLITDILDLSKIELGKLKLEISPLDPIESGEFAIKMIREQAKEKGIECRLESLSKPTQLEADPRRLRQILINLLGNAIKFADPETRVTLSIEFAKSDESVEFKVIDKGIGIKKADIERIFLPFSQVDDSLSKQYEGTGLGLAIVFKLVELHGGSLSVESVWKEGSSFSFRLPKDSQSNHPSNDSYLKTASDSSVSIAIIDENALSANLTKNAALDAGVRSIEIISPNNPIDTSEGRSPDIAIFDTNATQTFTRAWIASAMHNPSWRHTRWIGISSLDLESERAECKRLGAEDFHSKPISANSIRTAIELLSTARK